MAVASSTCCAVNVIPLATTSDLLGTFEHDSRRINSGGSVHTAADRPWKLVAAIDFASESSAVRFERYLKSGSGAHLRSATSCSPDWV